MEQGGIIPRNQIHVALVLIEDPKKSMRLKLLSKSFCNPQAHSPGDTDLWLTLESMRGMQVVNLSKELYAYACFLFKYCIALGLRLQKQTALRRAHNLCSTELPDSSKMLTSYEHWIRLCWQPHSTSLRDLYMRYIAVHGANPRSFKHAQRSAKGGEMLTRQTAFSRPLVLPLHELQVEWPHSLQSNANFKQKMFKEFVLTAIQLRPDWVGWHALADQILYYNSVIYTLVLGSCKSNQLWNNANLVNLNDLLYQYLGWIRRFLQHHGAANLESLLPSPASKILSVLIPNTSGILMDCVDRCKPGCESIWICCVACQTSSMMLSCKDVFCICNSKWRCHLTFSEVCNKLGPGTHNAKPRSWWMLKVTGWDLCRILPLWRESAQNMKCRAGVILPYAQKGFIWPELIDMPREGCGPRVSCILTLPSMQRLARQGTRTAHKRMVRVHARVKLIVSRMCWTMLAGALSECSTFAASSLKPLRLPAGQLGVLKKMSLACPNKKDWRLREASFL